MKTCENIRKLRKRTKTYENQGKRKLTKTDENEISGNQPRSKGNQPKLTEIRPNQQKSLEINGNQIKNNRIQLKSNEIN